MQLALLVQARRHHGRAVVAARCCTRSGGVFTSTQSTINTVLAGRMSRPNWEQATVRQASAMFRESKTIASLRYAFALAASDAHDLLRPWPNQASNPATLPYPPTIAPTILPYYSPYYHGNILSVFGLCSAAARVVHLSLASRSFHPLEFLHRAVTSLKLRYRATTQL